MQLINANIIPMEGAAIPHGFVRVQGEHIAEVGPMSSLPGTETGEETVDLGGALLLPGFIDAHSHLGLIADGVGVEGDDLNETGDPCTPHLRAIDGTDPFDRGFAEARAAGITSVVVSPGSANPIAGQICALKTAGRWIDQMAIQQPLAMKFALGENPKKVYGGKSQTPYTRMATVGIIREQLNRTKQYMQEQQTAQTDAGAKPPPYDARCEALLPLLRGEMRAHVHAHKAYDILSAIRIADEFGLDCTLIHATEGYLIADILQQTGIPVVCGPMICTRTKPELVGLSTQNCKTLIDAGVQVAVSTDHPEVPINFLAPSAAVAMTAGLSWEQAIETLTIGAARTVGLEQRLGSIVPGKDADLTVWEQDPLTWGARPTLVLISGDRVKIDA